MACRPHDIKTTWHVVTKTYRTLSFGEVERHKGIHASHHFLQDLRTIVTLIMTTTTEMMAVASIVSALRKKRKGLISPSLNNKFSMTVFKDTLLF